MKRHALHNKADQAAKLLKSLANPHRLVVLCRLHTEECSVGSLEEAIGLKQSALSQHLARLRREGIVKTRREGQTIFYRLADKNTQELIEVLHGLFCTTTKKGCSP